MLALLLIGAGIWGGLALTSGSGAIPVPPPAPAGYHLARARGPVQHALVAELFRSGLNGYPVGKGAREHLQVWFDRETGLIRVRGRQGTIIREPGNVRVPVRVDEASSCAPWCRFSTPALFFYRYWPVDTTKFVRRPGIGSFHGREVIWLGKLVDTFAPSWRNGEWIALDPRTHDAVADRLYGTTDRPAGPILGETWVVRRFPDIPSNRFWFVLKNKPEITGFVRLQAHPLVVPAGRVTPRALRAAPQVVGGIGGATIFAAPTRTGYWQMFSVDKHGRVGGGPSHVREPHAIGVAQVGRGSLFSSRAYLVVAGGTLAQRGTKLFLVYAHGSRERIKPILIGKPVRAGFYYYVIPKAHRIRVGRPTALELVRGSRLVARQPLPMPYQGAEQPGELQVRVAQKVLGHLVPANHG